MRLYRFIKTDNNIDVTIITDSSGTQEKEMIIESPRGISVPGNVNIQKGSDAFLALGWDKKAGDEVHSQELKDFAKTNGLTLIIESNEGLTKVSATWDKEKKVCAIELEIVGTNTRKIEIHFPNSVTLGGSTSNYGTISPDKEVLHLAVYGGGHKTFNFTLDDLGLAEAEDLNIVVVSDLHQSYELTATVPVSN